MLTRIEIDGFKTFHNFVMEFSPFTVIAGHNASGKSNLFDALKLLSDLTGDDLPTAFSKQRGEAIEQFSMYANGEYAKEMSFAIEMLLDKNKKDEYGNEINLDCTCLRYELRVRLEQNKSGNQQVQIAHEQLSIIKQNDWIKKYISKEKLENWILTTQEDQKFIYTGKKSSSSNALISFATIYLVDESAINTTTVVAAISKTALSGVSSINSAQFKHAYAVKEEMRNWHFLQLNSEELRKPSSRLGPDSVKGVLSSNGANLAAVLHRLKLNDQMVLNDISRELANLVANFTRVDVEENKDANQYIVKLYDYEGKKFSSRVLSEGTLRLLTLCTLKYDENYKGILCFEQPEDGIHLYLIKSLMQLLWDMCTHFNEDDPTFPLRQVIINTHSATLLSYLLKMRKNQDCTEITIWFSQLVTHIFDDESQKRIKFHATKILPVVNSDNTQTERNQFDFITEKEKQFSLIQTINYLNTIDIKSLKQDFLDHE